MKQAFSLQEFPNLLPRVLSWAMMREALGLHARSHGFPTTSSTPPTTSRLRPAAFSATPTGFAAPPKASSLRPTASSILAQGNALGPRADKSTQPEGLPHHPARRSLPGMQQAFSLQRCHAPIPRALPWASMWEALGLQTRSHGIPTTSSTPPTASPLRPTASSILAQGNALGSRADRSTQPEGLPHYP